MNRIEAILVNNILHDFISPSTQMKIEQFEGSKLFTTIFNIGTEAEMYVLVQSTRGMITEASHDVVDAVRQIKNFIRRHNTSTSCEFSWNDDDDIWQVVNTSTGKPVEYQPDRTSPQNELAEMYGTSEIEGLLKSIILDMLISTNEPDAFADPVPYRTEYRMLQDAFREAIDAFNENSTLKIKYDNELSNNPETSNNDEPNDDCNDDNYCTDCRKCEDRGACPDAEQRMRL